MNWDWPLLGRGADLQRLMRDLHDEESHGVVISGAPGLGKTRLARELVDRAAKHKMDTLWVVATEAASTMPFGALARFLPIPDSRALDPLQVLQRSLREFEARASAGGLVVGVDNAHLLDPGSATLIHELARVDNVALVVTVREGHDAPDPITALWKDGLAQRVQLSPLTRSQFEELVTITFDEPVAPSTSREMWDLSLGNPLLFRELVRGALEAGTLVLDGDVWRCDGPLARSNRIAELIRTRLGSLGADETSCLETVAAAEPLGIALVGQLVDRSVVESLERRGLVVVEASDRRRDLRLSHPMYAEVIRQETPATRRAAIAGCLAVAVKDTGARRREDLLRVAGWMLDSGTTLEPRMLVEAARQALASFDLHLAERLARAAQASGAGSPAMLVLGESLFHQSRPTEAEQALASAMEHAENEQQRALAGLSRAFNLLLGLQRDGDAVALLAALKDETTDQRWRDELTAGIGAGQRISGASSGAYITVRELLVREDVHPRPLVRGLMVATTSATALGRFEEAIALVERGRQMWGEYPELRLDEIVAEAFSVFALGLSGELYQAERVGRKGLAKASRSHLLTDGVYWGLVLGEVLILRGLPTDALTVLEPAIADARVRDPLAVLGALLSVESHAATLVGDTERAQASLTRLATLRGRHAGGRAQALIMARSGSVRQAAQAAANVGRAAIDAGDGAWGMLGLHDAVRYGYPDLVLDELRDLAKGFDGSLAPAMYAHAIALHGRDAPRLAEVSVVFEAMGAMLYAAEAAAQAAIVANERNQPVLSGRYSARSSMLFAECQGLATPALTVRPQLLTPREDEIARLAASGLTSKEIAERLFISPRTVDNHLASVYVKLGVSSRQALPAALGVAS